MRYTRIAVLLTCVVGVAHAVVRVHSFPEAGCAISYPADDWQVTQDITHESPTPRTLLIAGMRPDGCVVTLEWMLTGAPFPIDSDSLRRAIVESETRDMAVKVESSGVTKLNDVGAIEVIGRNRHGLYSHTYFAGANNRLYVIRACRIEPGDPVGDPEIRAIVHSFRLLAAGADSSASGGE